MEFVQVVSVENMRKSDARTIAEHTPSAELMYRAAQGIFNSAKFVGRVAIVCGKGNNGGDGYALACILCKNGFTPTIFRASDGFSKDGLYYYKTAMSLGAEEMPMSQAAAFTGFDIVVDCLLGTGFSGELKGEMLEAIEQINMTNAYVISADINSGINGDTGVCSTAVALGYSKAGEVLAVPSSVKAMTMSTPYRCAAEVFLLMLCYALIMVFMMLLFNLETIK